MTNQEGASYLVFYKLKNGETMKNTVATVAEIVLPGDIVE